MCLGAQTIGSWGLSTLQKPKARLDPITVEATLLWRLSDRLVAMCQSGYLYYWFVKHSKPLGFPVKEGDMVFVTADPETREAYSMAPQNHQAPLSGALGGA